ncbi:hypothetical protein D9M68_394050 [compost metagenome]
MPFVTALVVTADGEQPGVLALGARVGLHGDGVETGDGAEPGLQLVDHQLVAQGLVPWGEGVQLGEFRPGDGDHLTGGVELHGAGAQGNHRLVQRQVLVLQLLEVTQHLGFAVVGIEHRMAQVAAAARQVGRDAADDDGLVQLADVETVVGAEEDAEELFHGVRRAGFVEADPQLAAAEDAQVDARRLGRLDDGGLAAADIQGQGVEEVLVVALDALARQAFGEDGGEPVDALGDALQALGAVVDGVAAGDIGQQHLGGTDVGVGLLAADVLFAGLQGHAQGDVAAGVLGNADDAPGHGALEFVAGGEEGSVGTAIAHGYAEALGRAEHHVRAQLAGRGEQQQAEQVGADAGQGLLVVQLFDQRPQVADLAVGIRVLQQGAEHLVPRQVIHMVHHQVEAERLGAGLHHRDGLRMAVFVDEEQVALRLGHALGQGHGFGGGGGLVEQRGAGQVEAGEVDGQLLEVQQRLQAALGDFRLVGGVGGVPAGVFQHVAQDHRGREGAVVTHADQAGPQLVLLGIAAQPGQGAAFVQRRGQVQGPIEADRRRHRLHEQLVAAGKAQGLEHGLLFDLVRTQVATEEGIWLLELGQRGHLGHGLDLVRPHSTAEKQKASTSEAF